jgi:hypothetical protein
MVNPAQTVTEPSWNNPSIHPSIHRFLHSPSIKRDRWHNSRANMPLLTLRSVSMQCMQCNVMQYNVCNAMQCNVCTQHNAMQCNAMQCTYVCTEVRPSVRNEVSQSFFFLFFYFLKYKNDKILLKPGFEPRTLSNGNLNVLDGRNGMKSLPLAKMEISM